MIIMHNGKSTHNTRNVQLASYADAKNKLHRIVTQIHHIQLQVGKRYCINFHSAQDLTKVRPADSYQQLAPQCLSSP